MEVRRPVIIVRWTAPVDLDLEGTDEELGLAAQAVREVRAGECCGISANVGGDPAPYDRTLSLVVVQATGERSRIRVDGDYMLVVGPAHALAALSDVLELVARDGGHAHFEWHFEHPFLDPQSVPLVVSRRESDAR